MEIFSVLLALCAGNSPVTGELPAQRPVTRSFDVFFDLRLNKRISKQSRRWWFETPSCSLWCHCNVSFFSVVSSTMGKYASVRMNAPVRVKHFWRIWLQNWPESTDICDITWTKDTHQNRMHISWDVLSGSLGLGDSMGLLPDTQICGLRMRREYRKRFSRQTKPLASDPDMHHRMCVMHVTWYMSGSLTRSGGKNVPGIPGACATRNFTYLVSGPWYT